MIILGVDLSYTCSAFVWYDTGKNEVMRHATVTIKPGAQRLCRAYSQFKEALGWDHILIDKLIVEGPALNVPNPRTLYMLGQLSGVFVNLVESYGLDPVFVSPTEVKKYITGKGNADKDVVATTLRIIFGIKFEDDKGYDLSDAAACCIWGANR